VGAQRVLVALNFLQLPKPPPRERALILGFLEQLQSNPNRQGDYQETDSSGRQIQIKIIGKHALTYWADHAVKEVKVTKIELADVI
jgi:hypothetical protein